MSIEPNYSFLSWLRQGIANNILNNDGDNSVKLRAKINVKLKVEATSTKDAPLPPQYVDKNIQLYGPGDIVGIDKSAIIKFEPKHWITNFEPNYLPYIDFYEEDFPWRYTPAKPNGDRLKPWLTLIVLEEKEFSDGKNMAKKPLPYFSLKSGVNSNQIFPKPSELWAWAHVHFNTELNASDVPAHVRQILSTDPDLAYSRIISPRKLKPNVGYHAFLIPSYESGRLAGLGLEIPASLTATKIAWEDPNNCDFPYYHRWYFRTGAVGDFEYLVNLLKPKAADPTVGFRELDLLHPGANISPLLNPELAGILRLGGALRVPTNKLIGKDLQKFEEEEKWRSRLAEKLPQDLANRINLADDYTNNSNKTILQWNNSAGIRIKIQDSHDIGEEDPDPVVTSPLYGQWHALQKRLLVDRNGQKIIYENNWVHELNLDPRYRIAAGIGTKVVQKNQETYMQAAWEQVGHIMEVNRKFLFGQLAKEISNHLFNKKVLPHIDNNSFLIAAPMLKRVLMDKITINYNLENSTLPLAAMTVNFRKVVNPKSVISKKSININSNTIINKLSARELVVETPAYEPTGALLLNRTLNNIQRADLKTFDYAVLNKFRSGVVTTPPVIKPPVTNPVVFTPVVVNPVVLNPVVKINTTFAPIVVNPVVLKADIKLNDLKVNTQVKIDVVQKVDLNVLKPYPNKLPDVEINAIKPQIDQIGSVLLNKNIDFAVQQLPKVANFSVVELGKAVDFKVGSIESAVALRFKEALKDSLVSTLPFFTEVKREVANLPVITNQIKIQLNPNKTIPNYLYDLIKFPSRIPPVFKETFTPVMEYPIIDEPMYKPLSDLSKEYFLPNIDKISENSITLLENNQKFIEAYMVGINHEMSRELLWREFPTDQRGSYFRQFWDVKSLLTNENSIDTPRDKLRDITRIHEWSKFATDRVIKQDDNSPLKYELGTHNQRTTDGKPALVLVIRGELLKKYPNTIIYAHRAEWGQKNGQFDISVNRELVDLSETEVNEPPTTKLKMPIFEAKVDPDIYFFGFDLTAEAAEGTPNPQNTTADPGWFFVLKERPGEPRFGLDEDKASKIINWNNLSWKDVGTQDGNCIELNKTIILSPPGANETNLVDPQDSEVQWAQDTDSAELAYLLYQVPVQVAIHAKRLLPK
jgi:hypothetical protein